MRFILYRWLSVIVIVLATFWPDYGLVWFGVRNFSAAPVLWLSLGCVWILPLALVLPLSRKVFVPVTTLAICGIYALAGFALIGLNLDLWQAWWFPIFLGLAGIVLGWWLVSTRIWRWARGIVAVEDAEAGEH